MAVHNKVVAVQYTNIIYGYMGFAGFSIFFILTGVIALRLLEKAGIAMDAFSFIFILWNFAVSYLLLGAEAQLVS